MNNNFNNGWMNQGFGMKNNNCPKPCNKPCNVTVECCKPIITCSDEVIEDYHIVKQPYIHKHHTKIVHHHIKEEEFIPEFTCSEVHVNDGTINGCNKPKGPFFY